MYCEDCGFELNGQAVCPVCGWRVPYNGPVPSQFKPAENIPVRRINMGALPVTPSDSNTSLNTKKKNKLPLFILLGIIISGAAAALIIFICGNKDDIGRGNNGNPATEGVSDAEGTADTDTGASSAEQPDSATPETTDDIFTDTTTEIAATEAFGANGGTRTIMMYIVGSNLESEGMAATSDIQEILDADFDESKVNYLIFTGGSKEWYNENIDAESNCTFIIKNSRLQLLDSEPAANMGDPSTLSGFLTYCHDNYPADQYDLILWNHGGGIFGGYGCDELSNDTLLLDELTTALDESPFSEKNKLDFVGFDACLMASIEIADALSPYANYLISSQESEPSWGWDYSFLNGIENTSDGSTIGTTIVDKYIKTTTQNFGFSLFSSSDITLSVMDLDKVADVEVTLNEFASAAHRDLNTDTFSDFSKIRNSSKKIAASFQNEQDFDIVDLKDLALNFQTDYPEEATALINAVDSLVLYSDTNENNANGVSIYWPQEIMTNPIAHIEKYKDFDFADDYTALIENYANLLTDDDTLQSDYTVSNLVPYMNTDYTFSLRLTPEQAYDIKSVSYVISHADTNNKDNVCFVEMSSETSLDNNILTANFDGNIIYILDTTTKEVHEVMYTQQEETLLYTRYLIPSILYNDSMDDEDAIYAYFVLETSLLNPTGDIIGCYPVMNYIQSNGEDVYPQRYEIDVSSYQNVAFGSYSHHFSGDENLDEFTESDWEDVMLEYTTMPIANGFTTIRQPMIDGIPYFGMFIIEDSQGKKHASSLVQIK